MPQSFRLHARYNNRILSQAASSSKRYCSCDDIVSVTALWLWCRNDMLHYVHTGAWPIKNDGKSNFFYPFHNLFSLLPFPSLLFFRPLIIDFFLPSTLSFMLNRSVNLVLLSPLSSVSFFSHSFPISFIFASYCHSCLTSQQCQNMVQVSLCRRNDATLEHWAFP